MTIILTERPAYEQFAVRFLTGVAVAQLHVSWGIGDCHWGVRRTEENTFMLIIGRALFSTSDINETLYLTPPPVDLLLS